MKNIIIVILLLLLVTCSKAQSTFFTTTQGTNIFNQPYDLLVKPDNNILFLNSSVNPNNNTRANEIYELNPYGEILQVKIFVDSMSYHETYTQIFMVDDTIYTFGKGEKVGSSPYLYFLINKLDMQLTLLDSYEVRVVLPNYTYPDYMCPGKVHYKNGSFTYISSSGGSSLQPFLVEISQNGDLIRTEYDYVSSFQHFPHDFIKRPREQGFLVFMFENAVPGQAPGGYMVTYDNKLNIDNHQALSNDFFSYFTALPISSSTFYLSGSWFELSTPKPWRTGLVKMRPDGTVLNEFIYDVPTDSTSSPAYWNSIDTLSDGSVILCGTINIVIQLVPQQEPAYTTLFKLTPNLELLWQRYIGTEDDGKYDAFVMRTTPEDDIVIFGAFSEVPPVSSQYMEPMFIKTNSDGLFTGMENNGITSTEAILYPNPANDHVNIEFSQVYQKATFQLMDIGGKMVLEKKLSANRQAVDISAIPVGTYVYRIFNKEGLDERGKVVKE